MGLTIKNGGGENSTQWGGNTLVVGLRPRGTQNNPMGYPEIGFGPDGYFLTLRGILNFKDF